MLVNSLTARPRTALTADPLPFANAEAPLRNLETSALQRSSGRRQEERDGGGDVGSDQDAASVDDSEGQQSELKQDSPDLMGRAKSLASRLKIQRKSKRTLALQRMLKEQTTDVQTIQAHLAALIKACPALPCPALPCPAL
jgi:hypothetical protein